MEPRLVICFGLGIFTICLILIIISLSKISRLKKKLKDLDIDNKLAGAEFRISQMLNKSPAAVQSRAITGVGVEKYDAFQGVTGKFSFSVALVNDSGDGVIITTLYGHENCSTYLREIKGGRSDVQLSGEEISALRKARKEDLGNEG